MANDSKPAPTPEGQDALGGSYLRMADGSLLQVEGHAVPDAEREARLAVRDKALADAKAKHEAEQAAKSAPAAAPVQPAAPPPQPAAADPKPQAAAQRPATSAE